MTKIIRGYFKPTEEEKRSTADACEALLKGNILQRAHTVILSLQNRECLVHTS